MMMRTNEMSPELARQGRELAARRDRVLKTCQLIVESMMACKPVAEQPAGLQRLVDEIEDVLREQANLRKRLETAAGKGGLS